MKVGCRDAAELKGKIETEQRREAREREAAVFFAGSAISTAIDHLQNPGNEILPVM